MSAQIESEESVWHDPRTGAPVALMSIVEKAKRNPNYTVHVGTDSHKDRKSKGKISCHTFATVICLYEQGKGADYYFRRMSYTTPFHNLKQRIMEEVSQSVNVSLDLLQHIPKNRIIVHADINSDSRHKTFSLVKQVQSWVTSVGFDLKCKPDAWASSGVADKHAK